MKKTKYKTVNHSRVRTGHKSEPREQGISVRTELVKTTFLGLLGMGWSAQGAARGAGVSKSAMYAWFREDPEFAREWEEAYEEGTDYAEDELRRRAIEGVRGPKGVRIYSDRLLLAMLAARRPHKWARTANGEPALPPQNKDDQMLTRDQLEQLARDRGIPIEMLEDLNG